MGNGVSGRGQLSQATGQGVSLLHLQAKTWTLDLWGGPESLPQKSAYELIRLSRPSLPTRLVGSHFGWLLAWMTRSLWDVGGASVSFHPSLAHMKPLRLSEPWRGPLAELSAPSVPIPVRPPPSSLPKQTRSRLYPAEALAPKRMSPHSKTPCTTWRLPLACARPSHLPPACPCCPAHVPALNGFPQGVQERAVVGRRAASGPLPCPGERSAFIH